MLRSMDRSCSYLLLLLLQCEFLLLDHLELVAEVEFSGLLLQLGKFVFVFGDLLQGWLNAARMKERCD